MELTIRRLNNAEWNQRLTKAVRRAFNRIGHQPSADDIDTATQTLRIRLMKPKEFEEGRAFGADDFLRSRANFSVLTYLAERFERSEEYGQVGSIADFARESGIDEDEARLDPLYGGSLLRLIGNEDEILGTAPYEVQFASEEVEYSRYDRDPFALPSFRIVARDEEARSTNWRSGRRRYLHHEHLRFHGQEAIKQQRERYASCLRAAIPGYMHWLGVQGLMDSDRRVVTLINREHCGDAEVKRRLNIPHSTYHGIMGRLARNGFDDCHNGDKQRVIKYNPVLDSTQRYVSLRDRSRIMQMSVSEVIEVSEDLYEKVSKAYHLTPDDVAQIARGQKADLLMAKMDIDAISRHDARLRSFIRLIVEKPAIGKGVTLYEIESLLSDVSKKQARELVYRSLRYQLPVTEVLGLSRLVA